MLGMQWKRWQTVQWILLHNVICETHKWLKLSVWLSFLIFIHLEYLWKQQIFKCWIMLTVSTVGSSRPRFLRGTSDEESWEDDGVEAGPPLILTAVDLSANGVEARLSESFPPLSDLRVLVAFLFFLQRIKIVHHNRL